MFGIFALLSSLHPAVASAIVSAVTTLLLFLLGAGGRLLYDRYSLNYRIRRQYALEQQQQVKKEIGNTKVHLLNAAEDLNFRFWNLSANIDNEWHNIPISDWHNRDNYYSIVLSIASWYFFALFSKRTDLLHPTIQPSSLGVIQMHTT